MSDPSPVPSSSGPSNFRSKVGRSLVQALVIIFIIGILDVLAAQVCRSQCDFLFHLEHRKKYRIKNAVYHHGLTPNVSVMGRWGNSYYPFRVNSLGFRDGVVRNIPLKASGPRLLFIGDSFTEGQGVVFEKTFVGRIASVLKKDGIEVLNAAVSSYAPTVYYSKLRYLIETKGLEVSHVAVFIDISDIYDEAHWYRLRDDGTVGTRNKETSRVARQAFGKGIVATIRDNSLIVTLLYRLRDALVFYLRKMGPRTVQSIAKEDVDFDLWLEKTTGTREAEWIFDEKAEAAWGRVGIDQARDSMDRLWQFLKSRGIKMMIAAYPWPDNIVKGDSPSRHTRVWRDWATKRDVPFLDLFPVFIDGQDPERVLTEKFIPYDVHWNEQGHALVARSFLDFQKEAMPLAPVE